LIPEAGQAERAVIHPKRQRKPGFFSSLQIICFLYLQDSDSLLWLPEMLKNILSYD